MKLKEHDALPAGWDNIRRFDNSWLGQFSVWLRGVSAIVELEVLKIWHDPTEILTRALQPVFWLVIFGQAFGQIRAFSTGDIPYQVYITPGILAQSMMFVSIFFGLAIIFERDLGLLQKMLVLPLPRSVFVVGKAVSAGVRSITQAVMVLALAVLIGIPLRWGIIPILGVIVTIVLGGMIFASFSMVMAAVVKTRERFMGLGQLFTMPFFFTSNALYPISIMPKWMQVFARINPLTYVVDLLRGFLVTGQPNLLHSFGILIFDLILFTAIASRLYHTTVY
jgi:ABC-2 type transport system permease protein